MQRLRDNGQRLHKAAMTKVRFISADGQEVLEVDAPAGTRLLDLAQAHGQPLEGTCEGAMACSTCHVVIDPVDFDKLPKATEPEEAMLDFAAGVRRTSRPACQSYLTNALESLTARMPGAVHTMLGRPGSQRLAPPASFPPPP